MKVLVTGANGLLASNLVRELIIEGHEVRGMVRSNSNLLSLKKTDIELFTGEITNPSDLRKAFAGCEAVVHAAANTAQWPTNYEAYTSANVDATRLILNEAIRRSVEKFVFVSSANAFDPGTKETPGTETSPFTKEGKSGYMFSKYVAQRMVLNEFKRSGFPALVVNPTFMIGRYDVKPSSGQLILMAHRKAIMGYPPGGKNFVHVEDVAKGIANSLVKGKAGECYLLANENLSYFEFFQKLRLVCGYPRTLVKIPPALLYAIGTACSLYEQISRKPAKLNKTNAGLLCLDNYYTAQKAVTELNMPQTPVTQAIEDAMEWFRQYGYLKEM